MEEWRAIIARDSKNIEARLELAQAHLKAGERSDALRLYQEVIEIAPDHPGLRRALGPRARREGGRAGG